MPASEVREPPAAASGPQAYAEAADEEDIRACFRLLLGRWPNPEEWRGHAMQAGQPLARVVAGYLGSLEFARRDELRAATDLGPVELTRLPEFAIYTAADDAAVGHYVRADNYEREVAAVFRRLLRPGGRVVDVGANIGYFTMLAAHLVGAGGSVLAVEPNAHNARMIEASRQANGFGQVRVVQLAAGLAPGLLVLNRTHSNGTTSRVPDEAAALLGAETVGCAPLDSLLGADERVDFIKVDVEGAEYLALAGGGRAIARSRPLIVSEFSPTLMPGISGLDGPSYLRWLTGLGYRLSVIMPDGSLCGADEGQVMAEHRRRGSDHLDLLAEPLAPTGPARRGGWRRRLGLG